MEDYLLQNLYINKPQNNTFLKYKIYLNELIKRIKSKIKSHFIFFNFNK